MRTSFQFELTVIDVKTHQGGALERNMLLLSEMSDKLTDIVAVAVILFVRRRELNNTINVSLSLLLF